MKRFLGRYAEQRLIEAGFTDFKISYIAFLANLDEGGITNNELARRAGVTKQAMSKVVRLLEDEGYIYSVKDEKDSRSSRIFINDRGKQLLKAVFNCMQDLRRKFDDIAGHDRVGAMLDTMVLLVRELEKESGEIPLPIPVCPEE
ncbi:MarR family winged helix-turn-helix transcriptional regulator [Larkinella soli]|uniref:MarR family winged helix-turn-helix transcriptional regulator n=1 Tax=Larkinella soli TaxID=1770527 RepID=UPI001E4A887A|nr:MarR family transcriptional regulator [Larkinella soli]